MGAATDSATGRASGAGVGGGDDDAGRRYLRVLGDGQRPNGDAAREDDDDRHHRGEDRPVDEEARENTVRPPQGSGVRSRCLTGPRSPGTPVRERCPRNSVSLRPNPVEGAKRGAQEFSWIAVPEREPVGSRQGEKGERDGISSRFIPLLSRPPPYFLFSSPVPWSPRGMDDLLADAHLALVADARWPFATTLSSRLGAYGRALRSFFNDAEAVLLGTGRHVVGALGRCSRRWRRVG